MAFFPCGLWHWRVMMRCLERLALQCQPPLTPPPPVFILDQQVNTLHTALCHLEQQKHMHGCCLWTTVPPFNIILPEPIYSYYNFSNLAQQIVLQNGWPIGVKHYINLWVKDFLLATVHQNDTYHTSTTRLCVEPLPLLSVHQLLGSSHNTNIVKFAEHATLIGLITQGKESAYRGGTVTSRLVHR